jgi:asparagine synthase (glutamine-hydrolysing)
MLAGVNACLPSGMKMRRPRAKVAVLARMLEAGSPDERYRLMMSHHRQPADVVLGASEPSALIGNPVAASNTDAIIERMMFNDLVTYLPGDILAKVDRASMAVSLEARVPLLDHRVVEFSWRVPIEQKVRSGQGKWLLRQVLYRYVPQPLMDRPKQGFGVPIGAWLRGPLRDWAESLLDTQRLREQGYFEPGQVRQLLDRHVSGHAEEGARLWDVLMFQAWLAEAGRQRLPLRDVVAA